MIDETEKGLSAEDAKHLTRSGDGGPNSAEITFREEVNAIVKRVRKEFGLTYYGAVGVLRMIAHDLMHEAECEGCDGCDD